MVKFVQLQPILAGEEVKIIENKCPKCPHQMGTVEPGCDCACHPTDASKKLDERRRRRKARPEWYQPRPTKKGGVQASIMSTTGVIHIILSWTGARKFFIENCLETSGFLFDTDYADLRLRITRIIICCVGRWPTFFLLPLNQHQYIRLFLFFSHSWFCRFGLIQHYVSQMSVVVVQDF